MNLNSATFSVTAESCEKGFELFASQPERKRAKSGVSWRSPAPATMECTWDGGKGHSDCATEFPNNEYAGPGFDTGPGHDGLGGGGHDFDGQHGHGLGEGLGQDWTVFPTAPQPVNNSAKEFFDFQKLCETTQAPVLQPRRAALPTVAHEPLQGPRTEDRLEVLLQNAVKQMEVAEAFAPLTLPCYQQITNLLCAATRSEDKACLHMLKYYVGQAPQGQFVLDVFESYLAAPDYAQVARNAVNYQRAATWVQISPVVAAINFLTGTTVMDWATLFAGGGHFVHELYPAFSAYFRRLICDTAERDLPAALERAREQHRSLFERAVVPGFRALQDTNKLRALQAELAVRAVPVAASLVREWLILDHLVEKYGWARAAALAS